MYNPGEIKSFSLKNCHLGPHITFYERNATTSAGFTIWHNARTLRSDGKSFFDLHLQYIWQTDLAKIPKVPGAQRNVNSAQQ